MSALQSAEVVASNPAAPLRADAARNAAHIRAAAISAFRGRGLSTPLEQIAVAAGVSKGTIYSRFGGRAGLVDAVIGELVATQVHAIISKAQLVHDPWERVAGYVRDRRQLQYREPAFTDALLMTYPDSPQLVALAHLAAEATEHLLEQGRASGVVRPDFTTDDLYYADVANGLALRTMAKPDRADYNRRTDFFLDGLRPRIG